MPQSDSEIAKSSYNLVRDREKRQTKEPQRYNYADIIAYALNLEIDNQGIDPISYKEGTSGPDGDNWKAAMTEEIDSLMKNNTWELVEKPTKQRILGCKWIYKRKSEIPGVERNRYKVRLVAKGFTQRGNRFQ